MVSSFSHEGYEDGYENADEMDAYNASQMAVITLSTFSLGEAGYYAESYWRMVCLGAFRIEGAIAGS